MIKPKYETIINIFNMGATIDDIAIQTDYTRAEIGRFLLSSFNQAYLRIDRAADFLKEYITIAYQYVLEYNPIGFQMLADMSGPYYDFRTFSELITEAFMESLNTEDIN